MTKNELLGSPKWLIWSSEHQKYWKAGMNGYTVNRSKAGRYSLQSAYEAIRNSVNLDKDNDVPCDMLVPVDD